MLIYSGNKENKILMDIQIKVNELEVNELEVNKLEVKPLNRKPRKLRLKTPKIKDFASCPTSLLSAELTTSMTPKIVNKNNKTIKSDSIQRDMGLFSLSQDYNIETNPLTTKQEILKQCKDIGFTREELQLYLALFTTYDQNIPKSEYGIPFLIELPYLHNKLLKKTKNLQKKDIKKYKNILNTLSMKKVEFTTIGANKKPYNLKNMKDTHINSTLINASIITDTSYKYQLVEIIPSEYTLLELKGIGQINNCFPKEFIELDFDKSNNVFYFGLYLARMHRNNATTKINKKTIKNKKFAWECELKKMIENALPDGEELINKLNKEKKNYKYFFNLYIEDPLMEAIENFAKYNYFIPNKNKPILYKKDVFTENKLKFYFNYDFKN